MFFTIRIRASKIHKVNNHTVKIQSNITTAQLGNGSLLGNSFDGFTVDSVAGDYFGLPTVGQVVPSYQVSHSALPLRAYNLIFNEWFRDENLDQASVVNVGDGPDLNSD